MLLSGTSTSTVKLISSTIRSWFNLISCLLLESKIIPTNQRTTVVGTRTQSVWIPYPSSCPSLSPTLSPKTTQLRPPSCDVPGNPARHELQRPGIQRVRSRCGESNNGWWFSVVELVKPSTGYFEHQHFPLDISWQMLTTTWEGTAGAWWSYGKQGSSGR